MPLTTLLFFYLTQIHKQILQTCIGNIVFYGNTQINCKARKENVKFRTKVDQHDFIIFIFVYDKINALAVSPLYYRIQISQS